MMLPYPEQVDISQEDPLELKDYYYSYSQNMEAISSEELLEGLLGHGMFSEKIPPIFTSEKFYDFCQKYAIESELFPKKIATKFIVYESMRNTNVPRSLAIPHPAAYRNLCFTLKDSWELLKRHFKANSQNQDYKVSRIHIRKIFNSKKILEWIYEDSDECLEESDIPSELTTPDFFNEPEKFILDLRYKNIYLDGDPDMSLRIGKGFLVKTDISNFFPSIYSHSIPWALVGKKTSKEHRTNTQWYNKIDFYTRNLKDSETQGVLVGPHTSNLISEIILLVIDNKMHEKYKYIRYIDDFIFYAKTSEEAEHFLIDLTEELKKFNLALNHKKTEISPLPSAHSEYWVSKLKCHPICIKESKLGLNETQEFMELIVSLMKENGWNTAIINYGAKILIRKNLNRQARFYYINYLHHLVLLFPYLISIIENILFEPFLMIDDDSKKIPRKSKIQEITQDIFKMGSQKKYNEALSYSVYFSLKYSLDLSQDNLFKIAEESKDCTLLTLAYLYDKNITKLDTSNYTELALKLLNQEEMDQYWLFIYEVLTEEQLKNSNLESYWSRMKQEKISFISDINQS